jgi:hypothetical protein
MAKNPQLLPALLHRNNNLNYTDGFRFSHMTFELLASYFPTGWLEMTDQLTVLWHDMQTTIIVQKSKSDSAVLLSTPGKINLTEFWRVLLILSKTNNQDNYFGSLLPRN